MANGLSDEERQREADRVLRRVEAESDVVGASALARTANKARGHFAGEDADQNDPIEIWGRRIGRGISLLAFIGLAIWLINYLMR